MTAPVALWIDESLITLCQRVRLQRGFPPTQNELAPRSYPAGTQRGGSLTAPLDCGSSAV